MRTLLNIVTSPLGAMLAFFGFLMLCIACAKLLGWLGGGVLRRLDRHDEQK